MKDKDLMKNFINNNLKDMFIDYLGNVIQNDILFTNTCAFYTFIKNQFNNILDSMEDNQK